MQHVYHLIDPDDETVRYIGKTASPKSRLRSHIQDARDGNNTDKKRWIRRLLSQGKMPVMVIVASFPDEPSARLRESAECQAHLATIYNIHNPAKGARDFAR